MFPEVIVIVSQSHLCRNPRVLKEALSLSQKGFKIIVLTAIYSDSLLQEDLSLIKSSNIQYEFYSDLRSLTLTSFKDRFVKKLFTLAQKHLYIESKFSLGYGVGKLKRLCKKYQAQLYIMHQELAIVIGSEMLACNYKVFFDFEDWYSEDLLAEARRSRPLGLLKSAEKRALQLSTLCITTSSAMALALAERYKTDRIPQVIYNSFNASRNVIKPAGGHNVIRLYWFSQTIGEGRGLEFFITAMGKSRARWELYLRGNTTDKYQAGLRRLLSQKDKLIILPMQTNNEILGGLQEYHIGLALEPAIPANKDLTISNKFFHYMAAGLPIIASATKGHAEIGIHHPDFIFMFRQNNESDLVAILERIAAEFDEMKFHQLKEKVLEIFCGRYAWKVEEKKLVNLIFRSLENSCHATN